MKRALIINEGYSNNLGDQAIKKAMVNIFEDNGYTTSFLYLSKPKLNKIPSFDYLSKKTKKAANNSFLKFIKSYVFAFLWYFRNKKTIVNNLKNGNYDIIAIGGGQLVISSSANTPSGFSIFIYWFTRLIKKHTNTKLYLAAVGCATKFNKVEMILYRSSFKKIDKVWMRDKFSQENSNLLFNCNAILSPDIAFYNKDAHVSISKTEEKIALVGVTNYEEVFVKYNPKSSITRNEYFDQFFDVVKEYQFKGSSVKLFYTTKLDADECVDLKEYIFDTYQVTLQICDINNIEDLTAELDKATYAYSGRMHGLILAMKSHCIVTPHLVSQKLQSFNIDYIKGDRDLVALSKEIENQFSPMFS